MSLKDFEKGGALQILVYLYENKDRKINISELDRTPYIKANRETILTAIKVLKNNHVLEEEIIKNKFPPEHLVWLTELGVRVASRMMEAAQLIHGVEPQKSGPNV